MASHVSPRGFLALALLAGAASSLPVDSSTNYVFRVMPDSSILSSIDMSAVALRYPMTAADGEAYTCFLPAEPSGPADEKAASTLQRVADLIASWQPPCVLKRVDYWTYEVCGGREVRQFHEVTQAQALPQPTSASGGTAGGTAGSADGSTAGAGGDSGAVPPAQAAARAAAAATTGGSVQSTQAAVESQSQSQESQEQVSVKSLGTYVPDSGTLGSSAATGAVTYSVRYEGGEGGRSTTVVYSCEPAGMSSGVQRELVRVAEEPQLHYTIHIGSRDAALCELLVSPSRLLSGLNQSCIEHVDGWWTYELCLGIRLRQYHNDAGKAVQDSIIGVYDWRAGESVDTGKIGAPPALVQKYSGGSPCDVRSGLPRQASVRFECVAPEAAEGGGSGSSGSTASARYSGSHTLSLLSIKENPTCEYTISFGTALACQHPAVSPAASQHKQPPPATVYCLPDHSLETL